jgi:hypothetical protein
VLPVGLLYKYITMHGPMNVKFSSYLLQSWWILPILLFVLTQLDTLHASLGTTLNGRHLFSFSKLVMKLVMNYGLHGRVSNSIVAGGVGRKGRGVNIFSSTMHIEVYSFFYNINNAGCSLTKAAGAWSYILLILHLHNSSQLPTWCTTPLFLKYFITSLYLFRALLCSSSGGKIVLLQHLVSSLWKKVISQNY